MNFKKIVSSFLIILALTFQANANPSFLDKLIIYQHKWANINYIEDEKSQAESFELLSLELQNFSQFYSGRAEPLILEAITLSSYAGAVGGLQSLTKAIPAVKTAKDLLDKALVIDPNSMNGSIYTTLGALYYMVPGWPIGFGDDDKAESLLKKAVKISNYDLDAGFFYGQFLFKHHDYSQAKKILEQSLQTAVDENRPIADKGRREEIMQLLSNINEKKLKKS